MANLTKIFTFFDTTLNAATGEAYDTANTGIFLDNLGNEHEVDTGDLLFATDGKKWALAISCAWPLCEWNNGEIGEFHAMDDEYDRQKFLNTLETREIDKFRMAFDAGDQLVDWLNRG